MEHSLRHFLEHLHLKSTGVGVSHYRLFVIKISLSGNFASLIKLCLHNNRLVFYKSFMFFISEKYLVGEFKIKTMLLDIFPVVTFYRRGGRSGMHWPRP